VRGHAVTLDGHELLVFEVAQAARAVMVDGDGKRRSCCSRGRRTRSSTRTHDAIAARHPIAEAVGARSEPLVRLIATMDVRGYITNADVRDALEVPRKVAQAQLGRWVRDSVLVREGDGRWTRYRAAEGWPPRARYDLVAAPPARSGAVAATADRHDRRGAEPAAASGHHADALVDTGEAAAARTVVEAGLAAVGLLGEVLVGVGVVAAAILAGADVVIGVEAVGVAIADLRTVERLVDLIHTTGRKGGEQNERCEQEQLLHCG